MTTLLLYFAFVLVHGSTKYRNCKFQNGCPTVAHPCVSWAHVIQCKDFFLIPDNEFCWIYKLNCTRRNLKFKKSVKNFPHVEINAKGWEKASWEECRLGSQTVLSGFSTFSVLWAAGTHMAVANTLALSAGTLMASAGTPYRLVPAHFYPCPH